MVFMRIHRLLRRLHVRPWSRKLRIWAGVVALVAAAGVALPAVLGVPWVDAIREFVSSRLADFRMVAFILLGLIALILLGGPVRAWWHRRSRESPRSLAATSLRALGFLILASTGLWVVLGQVIGGTWPWELSAAGTTRYTLTRMVLYIAAGAVGVIGVVVAYRRQQGIEEGHFLERLAEAARQVGDQNPTVQATGIYALAGLADTSPPHRRQQCVDVLCAYLRLPYSPRDHTAEDVGSEVVEKIVRTRTLRFTTGETAEEQTLSLRPHERETRQTIVRVIAQHLRPGAAVTWSGLNFDFTQVVFDGGDFSNARFAGDVLFQGAHFIGDTTFRKAQFTGHTLAFQDAQFLGGTVSFASTQFTGETVNFTGSRFLAGTVDFFGAEFGTEKVDFTETGFMGGTVGFGAARFTRGTVEFYGARFAEGVVTFRNAQFTGKTVLFQEARFAGGTVDFDSARFACENATFYAAHFDGSTVNFEATQFAAGDVDFVIARFDAGKIDFFNAEFSGGLVDFSKAHFNGATIDFQGPKDWSVPPRLPWRNDSIPGVLPHDWPPTLSRWAQT